MGMVKSLQVFCGKLARGDESKDLTQRLQSDCGDKSESDNGFHRRGAERTGPAEMLTSGQAGAVPFDPAQRDLRMNRPAGRFTSSALTPYC
jgi:hypothetical protein